jgi:hypothetical protein
MVGATFRMRSWARALMPCWVMARSSSVRNRQRAGRCADVAGGHLGVFSAGRGEAFELLLAGANDAVANRGQGFGICATGGTLIAGHTPVYLPTLARRRTETLDCRLFGSLAQTRTHVGSSEGLVHSPWLASCTICV